MGLSTAFSSMLSSGLSTATGLLGDIAPILGAVFAVGVLGLVLFSLSHFISRK